MDYQCSARLLCLYFPPANQSAARIGQSHTKHFNPWPDFAVLGVGFMVSLSDRMGYGVSTVFSDRSSSSRLAFTYRSFDSRSRSKSLSTSWCYPNPFNGVKSISPSLSFSSAFCLKFFNRCSSFNPRLSWSDCQAWRVIYSRPSWKPSSISYFSNLTCTEP